MMNLNERQIKIVWIVGILIVVMCIIPPWKYTFQREGISQVAKPAGYSFVFSPPKPEKNNHHFGIVLDYDRLIAQLMGAFVVGALGVLALGQKVPSEPEEGDEGDGV